MSEIDTKEIHKLTLCKCEQLFIDSLMDSELIRISGEHWTEKDLKKKKIERIIKESNDN